MRWLKLEAYQRLWDSANAEGGVPTILWGGVAAGNGSHTNDFECSGRPTRTGCYGGSAYGEGTYSESRGVYCGSNEGQEFPPIDPEAVQ